MGQGINFHQIEDPSDKAKEYMGQATGSYGMIKPSSNTKTTAPGKTIGGAAMNGVGGAMAGAQLGAMGGPIGMTGGAIIGALSYFLS